jgi:hypothetical protein
MKRNVHEREKDVSWTMAMTSRESHGATFEKKRFVNIYKKKCYIQNMDGIRTYWILFICVIFLFAVIQNGSFRN